RHTGSVVVKEGQLIQLYMQIGRVEFFRLGLFGGCASFFEATQQDGIPHNTGIADRRFRVEPERFAVFHKGSLGLSKLYENAGQECRGQGISWIGSLPKFAYLLRFFVVAGNPVGMAHVDVKSFPLTHPISQFVRLLEVLNAQSVLSYVWIAHS